MAEKCIVPAEWKEYFDNFSKKIKGASEKVEIELVAPSVEDLKEGKNLPLIGISYDPKDKVLSVFCGDLDHIIEKPQEICVEEEDGGVKTIRTTDGTGMEHFIKLAKPL